MAGKVEIPDALKSDLPQSTFGKLLAATPVVMTVIATLLAGLASSEMTKAQYDRALGAQLQSKVGDQWSFFQAKKMRGAMQHNSFELLQATTDLQPVADPILEKLPAYPAPALEANIKSALEAVEKQAPEAAVTAALKSVTDPQLAAALQAARDHARDFDTVLAPANQELRKLEQDATAGDKQLRANLAAVRMKFSALRYDAEAKMNQAVANLLELQVRKANLSAERHHKRSGKFFFGMLAAQAAVIVSTMAMAARQRNLLWIIAAVAGLAAVAFAIYVYLKV